MTVSLIPNQIFFPLSHKNFPLCFFLLQPLCVGGYFEDPISLLIPSSFGVPLSENPRIALRSEQVRALFK